MFYQILDSNMITLYPNYTLIERVNFQSNYKCQQTIQKALMF
jgi:hypothetical protein